MSWLWKLSPTCCLLQSRVTGSAEGWPVSLEPSDYSQSAPSIGTGMDFRTPSLLHKCRHGRRLGAKVLHLPGDQCLFPNGGKGSNMRDRVTCHYQRNRQSSNKRVYIIGPDLSHRATS